MVYAGSEGQSKLYTYLLAFGRDFGPTEDVQKLLSKMPEIEFWYRCLPNAIFITSRLSARELHRALRKVHGGRCIILDCDTDYSGWLPKKAWRLIKNPYGLDEE